MSIVSIDTSSVCTCLWWGEKRRPDFIMKIWKQKYGGKINVLCTAAQQQLSYILSRLVAAVICRPIEQARERERVIQSDAAVITSGVTKEKLSCALQHSTNSLDAAVNSWDWWPPIQQPTYQIICFFCVVNVFTFSRRAAALADETFHWFICWFSLTFVHFLSTAIGQRKE